jgi:hypothetical protein
MNFDKDLSREIRVHIWDAGRDIGTSWRKFGDPRQIKQQQEKAGTPGSPMLIELMLADIWGQAQEGKLIAIGYRTEPNISDGPVLVPADTFSVRPEFDEAVNNDALTASGWRYERIKILSEEEYTELLNSMGVNRQDSERDKSAEDPSAINVEVKKPKRGGGRTSLYPNAKVVFEELFKLYPHFKSRTASKIEVEFSNLYRKTYSPDGLDFSSLSERTIRTHLKRYRKELENTGKK